VAAGHLAAAHASLVDGIRLARQGGQHQVVSHMLAVLALIAALRGSGEECKSFASEALELASARRLVHVSVSAHWALLVLGLGLGHVDDALSQARQVSELPVRLWAAPDRIEAAVRAGEPELAEAWMTEFDEWAQGSRQAWALAASLRCRALLAGDSEEAEGFFVSALAADESASRPLEHARTELAFGEFLRRTRRRREAREHLRAGLAGFEAAGAEALAERARVELRASGQTARRREPSTRDDLTPQELQIARLVAQGMSNREVAAQLFLSPRTIDFHLRNVFRKLGISSRMQLVQVDLGTPETSSTPEQPVIAPVRT
jgi:DNA-binding CsgD family transcriptional regulator